MRRIVIAVLSATLLTASFQATPANALGARRPVDLVVCLDTSGSMDQLIDSARGRIWDIVNTLARMQPTPELRVGLITYGSPGIATAEQGYVVFRSDLTRDLDAIYSELMALTTDGGEEMVARALDLAVSDMSWSGDPEALRIVFIAGNEEADQGSEHLTLETVGQRAAARDIIINAVFAGSRQLAVGERWPLIAKHGGGSFSSIDPVLGTIQIPTPQDEELTKLNLSLNETYVPYGARGAAGLANQVAQDGNATRLGVQACSSRVVAKGTALYDNASWDLVDALTKDTVRLDDLRTHELPSVMQGMSREEQIAHVAAKRVAREEIQEKIRTLSDAREAFLRASIVPREGSAQGLDDAIRSSLLEQAKAKGFACDGC